MVARLLIRSTYVSLVTLFKFQVFDFSSHFWLPSACLSSAIPVCASLTLICPSVGVGLCFGFICLRVLNKSYWHLHPASCLYSWHGLDVTSKHTHTCFGLSFPAAWVEFKHGRRGLHDPEFPCTSKVTVTRLLISYNCFLLAHLIQVVPDSLFSFDVSSCSHLVAEQVSFTSSFVTLELFLHHVSYFYNYLWRSFFFLDKCTKTPPNR